MNTITFTNVAVVSKKMMAGGKLCKLRVVENLYFGKKAEEMEAAGKQTKAYYTVNLWDKNAESADKNLTPGKKISVTGTLLNEEYLSGDGEKRTNAVVNATAYEFLPATRKPEAKDAEATTGAPSETTEQTASPEAPEVAADDEDDDDVPF